MEWKEPFGLTFWHHVLFTCSVSVIKSLMLELFGVAIKEAARMQL